MLRSKATAALMKLKEIDRKYKIKSSEDVKLQSSLSDISGIESGDEASKHFAGSADKPDAIITNARLKLDIRMPEAYMERTVAEGKESELVKILDKSEQQKSAASEEKMPPVMMNKELRTEKQNSGSPLDEENVSETLQTTSQKNPSPVISELERGVANTETSISEDVPEVVPSSHPVNNHSETDVSREITLKSVESIIDVDERVQSDLDEDPSTLATSRMYSDDFVKTFSSEDAKEFDTSPENVTGAKLDSLVQELISSEVKNVTSSTPPSYHQRPQSPELHKSTELPTKNIEEQASAKVLSIDSNLDASFGSKAKKIDRDVSEEEESPPRRRSSQSSSARSSKERRRSRKPQTSSSSRHSKSSEVSSSRRKKDSGATDTSEPLNPPKSYLRSSRDPPRTNLSKKDKGEKDLRAVFSLEVQNDQREAVAYGVLRSLKDDQPVPVIRREISSPKTKQLKHARGENLSTKVPPSSYSNGSETNKYVTSTMTGPRASKCLQFSKDDEATPRSAERSSKCRSISKGHTKRRSNKPKTGDSLGSRRRTKGGSVRRYKNQTGEEPGLGSEARNVDRLRQQIKEVHLKREMDQLRAGVRGYVQQMMNEQRRLSALDSEFQGPSNQSVYKSTGFGRTKSLPSFFKPLDLPNVAAFKRPDSEDGQAADLVNEGHLHLNMIRERVLGIRHWLKQQFVLYRDYSSLVSTINSKYIPVTLQETKKMIRDMQQFHDGRERRRCVR